MDFGEQIKSIRQKEKLTQEQFAMKLNVSRQAVSNWENNKNLPDIGMLILMSDVFQISLDYLIKGENEMNNMTEKVIKDGSETRRAKYNMVCSIIGIFLILRRQSLMSDTLSHVSLAGVAFGLFLGISPTLSTMIIVIIAAVFLEYLRTLFKDFMEIGTAILMSTGLALALVLMRGGGKSSMSLDQYLFGSTLTITDEQVIALFVIAFVVLVLTALFLRPMYILTFDEDTAFVDGLPVRTMSILFNVVTGVAIALMIPAAGSLLVSTIMVLPASIALKLGKNFRGVMLIAVIIGFIGMFSGLILSYIADTPASASITLLFVALFLLVNLGSRLRK